MDERDSHLTSLQPPAALTRRGFVVTSLAAGFALAVQPVSAATIVTDSDGLTAGEVKIPVSDGEIPGYRAMPAAGGPFATILVVHEAFGVHEHIKDICRRLAKAGYFAVAPLLFARQGDVSKMSSIDDVLKVMAKVPEAEVASDLDATVAWAAGTGNADTARLGITGFCWGGRQVWLYAEHNPKVKAAVAWYGPLKRPASGTTPADPIDRVAQLQVPVLGLYGGADPGIPMEQIKAMQDALAAGKTGSEIVVYPDTPHAFNADYRTSYRPAQAKDGWKRMLSWFKDHGVA
jgi:carboxymethylenebutenolidase